MNPKSRPAFRLVTDPKASMRRDHLDKPDNSGTYDGGGGPPHNEDMEARVKALEEVVKNLPTKADLAELRLDFADLRSDVKTGISDLRAEMHKSSIDIHKWMIGTVIGLFLGFGGLFMAMSNSLKQPPQATAAASTPFPAQQPNIIINVPPSTVPATPPAAAAPLPPVAPAAPVPAVPTPTPPVKQ